MQDLLRELAARLSTVDGQVDVLYALTPVVDGQALSGRLLLRLPPHPARRRAVDRGRLAGHGPAGGAGGGPGVRGPGPADAERTSRLSDDTVVTLDLVRRPAAALVPSA